MPSFFKKPAWANTDSSSPKTEFYRRSDRMYADVVAAEREKASRAQHTSTETKTEQSRPSAPHEPKRRRISGPEEAIAEEKEAAEENHAPSYKGIKPRKPEAPREQPVPKPAPTGQSPSRKRSNDSPIPYEAATLTSPPPASRDVVDVDSNAPNPKPKPAPINDGPQGVVNISDDEEDDDSILEEEEFPELARKARERARRAAESQTKDAPSTQAASKREQHGEVSSPQRSTQPAADSTEPRVEILITSDLENTKPLLIRRKLTQDLKDVRKYWCRRQEFSPEKTASVFLTWKGKRLFDVTTCKSLGVDRSNSDNALFESNDDEDMIRVHMEAVTEELFQAQKTQRSASFTGDEADESEDNDEDPGQIYRITLKAPSIEDLPLKVRPSTRIANIVSALQDARNLSTDKTIHLLFDGERLGPNSVVSDTDIADLDCVDALIK